jgi:hypothetical protein
MRGLWSVLFGAVLCVVGWATQAAAQPACLPSAGGVPGQPGVPNWWSEAPPAAVDDPRWRGSLGVGHTANEAEFRGLVETDGADTYLVLSWEVKSDPGFAQAGDSLFVGFFNEDTAIPANSKGLLVKMTRDATTTTVTGGFGTAYSMVVKYRDATTGGGWSNLGTAPPVPAWLSDHGRIDVTCDGAAPPTCDRWIMRLRVKLNPAGATSATGASDPVAGVPVGTNFRMFWDLNVESSGTTTHYKWPSAVADVDETAAPPSYPEPSTWAEFQTTSTPPCMAGISIQRSQIEVVTSPPTGSPHEISITGNNTFHARPTNGTGGTLDGNGIQARIRVADWGSAVGDSPSWRTIPGCDAATGSGSVATGANFDLTCSWALSAEDKCSYDPLTFNTCMPMPPQHQSHQCVLVELSPSATAPADLFFSKKSEYRNMDFVTASEFSRAAKIDLAGLTPLGGGATKRDTYLYVQTRNLPAELGGEGEPPGDEQQPPGQAPTATQELPPGQVPTAAPTAASSADVQKPPSPAPGVRDRAKLPKGPVGTKEAQRLRSLVASGVLTLDEVAEIMPSAVVHVWHDTGRKTASGSPVLEAQSSFGYLVAHDGALTGWKYALTSASATLVPVPNSRNFYKLAIDDGGSAVVTTSIEAVEPKVEQPQTEPPSQPPPGPRYWLWFLIAFVMLVVVILVSRNP